MQREDVVVTRESDTLLLGLLLLDLGAQVLSSLLLDILVLVSWHKLFSMLSVSSEVIAVSVRVWLVLNWQVLEWCRAQMARSQ